MLQTIRKGAQGECLNARNGVVPALAVDQDAREIRDLGNPPAVVFALELDVEVHEWSGLARLAGTLMPESPAV
jgi:hypothetical protein